MENQYSYQVPVTLNWVKTIMRGVPVGTQMAWLSIKSSGVPFDTTRVALLTNWAVTQGPFPVGGGGKVHPAIT
jgi:hypothetical protein